MISDSRLQKIARKIVRVNMNIKEKDLTIIDAAPNSLKFAEALAYEAAIIGAQPSITYGSDELSLKIFRNINPRYLRNWPKLADTLSKIKDAEIIIDDSNPFIERLIPQKKVEIRRKATKPIRDFLDKRIVKKNVKIALIGFPNPHTARALGISFKKLSRIFWDTLDVDYNRLYEYNKFFVKQLSGKDKVHITGKDTDLELSVKGRKIISACGLWKKEVFGYLNLPDGEVFTAPVENSVNGEIYFDLPCMGHYGKQVEGVWFKFKDGKLVEYDVDKGLEAFEDLYKNASGDKNRIGELGIGTNPENYAQTWN